MDADEIREAVDDNDDEQSTDSQMDAEEMKEERKEDVEDNDHLQSESAAGDALEYDESAYVMYHRAQTGVLDIELLALKVNVNVIVFAMSPQGSLLCPPRPATMCETVSRPRLATLVQAFVSSRVDYCCSLLTGSPKWFTPISPNPIS